MYLDRWSVVMCIGVGKNRRDRIENRELYVGRCV